MPGRKWYVVAGLVFVFGLVATAALVFVQLRGIGDVLQRIVVPGTEELALAEAGRHTIYHESVSTFEGRVFHVPSVAGLRVEVVEVASGRSVPVEAPGVSSTYSFGGREGTAILAFDVETPGRYRFTAGYDAVGGPETVLAVGRGFGTKIALTVGGAFAVAGLATTLALAIAAWTFWRRYRARKRAL